MDDIHETDLADSPDGRLGESVHKRYSAPRFLLPQGQRCRMRYRCIEMHAPYKGTIPPLSEGTECVHTDVYARVPSSYEFIAVSLTDAMIPKKQDRFDVMRVFSCLFPSVLLRYPGLAFPMQIIRGFYSSTRMSSTRELDSTAGKNLNITKWTGASPGCLGCAATCISLSSPLAGLQ